MHWAGNMICISKSENKACLLGWLTNLWDLGIPHLGKYDAWKIPWRELPGRLQFVGSQQVRHDWEHAHTHPKLKKKKKKSKSNINNNNNKHIIGNKASPQMIIIQCILMQQPCKKVCLSIYLSHWFLFLDHISIPTQENKRELSLPVQEVWISLRVNSTEIDLLYCLTMSKDLWYPISSHIVFVIGKGRNSGSGGRSARFGVEGWDVEPWNRDVANHGFQGYDSISDPYQEAHWAFPWEGWTPESSSM